MARRILFLIAWISLTAMAGISGKSVPSGDVESVIEMIIVPFEQLSSVLPEFKTFNTPPEGTMIATFIISNNNSDGFQISIESDQRGRFVRFVDGLFVANPKEGDYLTYELSIERGIGGVLGGDMPPSAIRRGLDVSIPVTVPFNMDLSTATSEAELYLMVHTKAKNELFKGEFRDLLTFVLADL